MHRISKAVASAAAIAGVVASGIGVAGASTGENTVDDNDVPITGEALEKATAAALAEAGGGEVTETEIEDEEGAAYEVEITLDDGTQLEVLLDTNFNVIGVEDETNEGPDDD